MELKEAIEYQWKMKSGEVSNLAIAAQADAVIREAYLAKHPADDDELITAGWLGESEDWYRWGDDIKWVCELPNVFVFYDTRDGETGAWEKEYGDIGVTILGAYKTRGQLRRLVKALKGE